MTNGTAPEEGPMSATRPAIGVRSGSVMTVLGPIPVRAHGHDADARTRAARRLEALAMPLPCLGDGAGRPAP